jgi:hypothetical protein
MDGSSLSLIIIPVVVVISLAAWLVAVAYAADHPDWKHGPASPHDAPATRPSGDRVPRPRAEIPRPAPRPAGTRHLVTAGTPTAGPSMAQGGGR